MSSMSKPNSVWRGVTSTPAAQPTAKPTIWAVARAATMTHT